jgi:hypothetical protein
MKNENIKTLVIAGIVVLAGWRMPRPLPASITSSTDRQVLFKDFKTHQGP